MSAAPAANSTFGQSSGQSGARNVPCRSRDLFANGKAPNYEPVVPSGSHAYRSVRTAGVVARRSGDRASGRQAAGDRRQCGGGQRCAPAARASCCMGAVMQQHRTGRRQSLTSWPARKVLSSPIPPEFDGRWNYPHQTAPPSKAGTEPADDIGFILRLMDALVADRSADAKRIYVSGTSNGAFLTYGLMCTASERLAATAVLIASMFDAQATACKPARAVPLMAIAGTNDQVVPYDGWLYPTGRLQSMAETMEFWRRLHACSGQRRTILPRGKDGDPTQITKIDWTGCARDGAVQLYRVAGGSHTLPSLAAPASDQGIPSERRSTAMETSDVVWQFFKQWSLP